MRLSTIIAKIFRVYDSITHSKQLPMANKYCHRLKHRVKIACPKDSREYPFEKRSAIDLIGGLILKLGNAKAGVEYEPTEQAKES